MWMEVYAGIYKAKCDLCDYIGQGWFFILNGSHDNGIHCYSCQKKKELGLR